MGELVLSDQEHELIALRKLQCDEKVNATVDVSGEFKNLRKEFVRSESVIKFR